MMRKATVIGGAGLLACPGVALGNAGTPLIWAGMLHLVFGNALIGAAEGLLLAWMFRLNKLRAIGLLIAANYVSAWVGYIVGFHGDAVGGVPIDLTNVKMYLLVMLAVAYVATLVLEFPFVAWAVRRRPGWVSRAVWGSLVVQTVSYAMIFGWYSKDSPVTLLTRTELVEAEAMALPADVRLFYIAAEDGDVYEKGLNAVVARKVLDLNSGGARDRLFVRPVAEEDGRWDLVARIDPPGRNDARVVLVRPSVALEAAVPLYDLPISSSDDGSPRDYHSAPQLGNAKGGPWEFQQGFWAADGLWGRRSDGKKLWIALETPLIAWRVQHVTVLPDERVLFQLGDDQICVFEINSGKIALVARGRGPVAVLAEERREGE